jgi:hypothetical protein
MARHFTICSLLVFTLLLGGSGIAVAQSITTGPAPTLIPLNGQLLAPDGTPRTGAVLLVLSLYEGKDDPAPRWIEYQPVTLDARGQYAVEFGATREEGLPADLFTGAAGMRWIGIAAEHESEQPRMMLVSVPYAAKAASADTLAGKPATEFISKTDFRSALKDEGVQLPAEEGAAPAPLLPPAPTANPGYVQKKRDSDQVQEDANIYDNGTNIGIGTNNPLDKLDVNGAIRMSATDTRIRFRPLNVQRGVIGLAGPIKAQPTNYDMAMFAETGYGLSIMVNGSANDAMYVSSAGNVGIGTSTPADKLDITGALRMSGSDTRIRFRPGGVQRGIISLAGPIKANSSVDLAMFAETGAGISFMVNGSPSDALTITSAGNIGVGTSSPSAKLHVTGGAIVTGDMSVNGNIAAKYQDVAEWVDSVEPLVAGTIVAIDVTAKNRVTAAARAYDTRVAGAVSPQPGLTLGEPGEGKVLVAQSGRVRIQADARYGAIRPGDLLVSSPTKGHAMRSKGDKVKPGTVIGKALEALPSGRGEILALLTLQ